MLGSIDANTGSPDLGWDTDQFPMDVKNSTLIMKVNMFVFSSSVHLITTLTAVVGVGFFCMICEKPKLDVEMFHHES